MSVCLWKYFVDVVFHEYSRLRSGEWPLAMGLTFCCRLRKGNIFALSNSQSRGERRRREGGGAGEREQGMSWPKNALTLRTGHQIHPSSSKVFCTERREKPGWKGKRKTTEERRSDTSVLSVSPFPRSADRSLGRQYLFFSFFFMLSCSCSCNEKGMAELGIFCPQVNLGTTAEHQECLGRFLFK